MGKVAAKARAEEGMATAEYAIGTVAVVSFGSLLVKILTDPAMRELVMNIVRWCVEIIMLLGW